MASYASVGGIAPTGTVDGGWISYAQADAYNAAVAAVQAATYPVDAGAQQYFDEVADQAMQQVSVAVDAYVDAAMAVIEVVRVNEIASDAQAAGDNETASAVQDYLNTNDVTLEEAEVDVYNNALLTVEETTQTAAAFMAVANSPDLIDSANQQADSLNSTYETATESYFDAAMGEVVVKFEGVQDFVVALMVNTYFKTTADILTEGQNSDFYQTGPTQNPCNFFQDPTQIDACQGG